MCGYIYSNAIHQTSQLIFSTIDFLIMKEYICIYFLCYLKECIILCVSISLLQKHLDHVDIEFGIGDLVREFGDRLILVD